MDELERMLTCCHGQVTTHVLFYRPAGFPDNWEKNTLWNRAAALPDARVRCDVGGSCGIVYARWTLAFAGALAGIFAILLVLVAVARWLRTHRSGDW